ncbi:zinc finger protein 85-like [Belonocnema kinseyi]|uniref:zinc finger protein 85-like n=1 Tax=Belonocnema kinseyi TaxID=2817044 RepID=UPI00143D70BF|nr:zinc finger protein 85-like [Belonocnema kinseyi]
MSLKLCTVYIRGDDISKSEPKVRGSKNQKFQDSNTEMKYTCTKCARTYKRKQTLTFHCKYECGVMPQFSCKLCGKLFKRKYDMNIHVDHVHHKTRSRKSVSMHKCDICPRSYIWPNDLTRHKRTGHGSVVPQFFYDSCEYKTNMKRNLLKHIASSHLKISKSRHNCDKCSRSYNTISTLNRHKRLEHAIVIPQFDCDWCEYKTERKEDLSKHIISRHLQTSETRHSCDKCSRSYKWPYGLNRHKLLEHAAVMPQFTCDICYFKAKHKYVLSNHITLKHVNN